MFKKKREKSEITFFVPQYKPKVYKDFGNSRKGNLNTHLKYPKRQGNGQSTNEEVLKLSLRKLSSVSSARRVVIENLNVKSLSQD